MAAAHTHTHAQLVELYEKHGQGHVFSHWSSLSAADRESLHAACEAIDLAGFSRRLAPIIKDIDRPLAAAPAMAAISPFPSSKLVDSALSSPADLSAWRALGLRALCDGEVALLLLAGGQGTRLGSAEPKGLYDIGLPSHNSIFHIQASRIHSLKRLAASSCGRAVASIRLPWYIMTSMATDKATREYFHRENYFGLPASEVFFFPQGELPAVDRSGRIIMEGPAKVAIAPNGNGGLFEALGKHNMLDNIKGAGVKYVHVFGVDNVLIRVADPVYVGWSIASGSGCTNKVVLKKDPSERVGVMCMRGDKPSIVEYSELPSEFATQLDAAGRLVYGAANIAQHFFTVACLSKFVAASPATEAAIEFPYHVAHKQIPSMNGPVAGIKLELFIFDAFESVSDLRAFAVGRHTDFSPVKNKEGADSPATAREDISRLHRQWIESAGGAVKGDGLVELSGLKSYEGENLEDVKGKEFDTTNGGILIQ